MESSANSIGKKFTKQNLLRAELDRAHTTNFFGNHPFSAARSISQHHRYWRRGDSRLVDHLLEEGFENITVLDISGGPCKSKDRLGNRSARGKWIETGLNTIPLLILHMIYGMIIVTFHFLTKEDQIRRYAEIASFFTKKFLVIGTFSETGPGKCSGLPVLRHSAKSQEQVFGKNFDNIRCFTEDHITPAGRTQNFQFCAFKRKGSTLAI